MSTTTSIEWTDATWNPIGGCDIVSPGCIDCYAMRLAGTRLHKISPYAGTTKRVKGKLVWNGMLTAQPHDHPVWTWPCRWRGAKEPKLGAGKPSLIFVGDMSDLFHVRRPPADIKNTIAAIIYSRHIGQFLTKRPEVMVKHITALERCWLNLLNPLLGQPNFDPILARFEVDVMPKMWLGISAERPTELAERWSYLRPLAVAGWQTFISMEPLLERMTPKDLFTVLNVFGPHAKQPWIIVGGKSGATDAPLPPVWVREIRDLCAEFGAPFFFKQWGEWAPLVESEGKWPVDSETCIRLGASGAREAEGWPMQRVGKKHAGHLLDGRAYHEFPVVAA